MKNYSGMGEKFEFVVNEHTTKVVENKDYWEVHFPEGPTQKLFYHVNAAKEGIWMWESGKIDEASLSIGALIEDALAKGDAGT
jgi:hypothetical protein